MNPTTLTQTQQSPTQAAPDVPRMPFGKHKGVPLTDLPPDYLLWVGLLPDLHQPLLGHILREMGRRIMELEPHAATAEKVTP